jgi:hypothetical protein
MGRVAAAVLSTVALAGMFACAKVTPVVDVPLPVAAAALVGTAALAGVFACAKNTPVVDNPTPVAQRRPVPRAWPSFPCT